jgi:hypothetical protein
MRVDQRQWRTAESTQKSVGRPDYFTNCGSSFSLTWHSFHFPWHATSMSGVTINEKCVVEFKAIFHEEWHRATRTAKESEISVAQRRSK